MPELPEVETTVRDVAPRLVGNKLRRPRLFKSDVLRGVSASRLLRTLDGNRVATVSRRAKHIVVRFETDDRLVIQLRMTGALIVYDRRLKSQERRYVVFQAAIVGGGTLVLRDVRRLGTISLLDQKDWQSYTARIGPEPLADDFTLKVFSQQLLGTRQAVKKALMDQRRVAGIGNIYANEALFRARIDPSRRSDRLTGEDLSRLFRATRAVLREAIRARGTTFRDYRNGTGGAGSYQRVLRVYGRADQPCLRCGTRLSTTHEIDGRATTFCWRCQGRRSGHRL